MIKHEELMIGDFVRWTSDQWSTEEDAYPFKIKAVYKGKVQIDGRNDWYVESLIEPVPLTEAILMASGFEIQHQGGLRYDVWTGFGPDCEGDIEIEFQGSVPIHLKIDGAFKGEYYTSDNIRYVHELQHALRLCGIEKKLIISHIIPCNNK